MNPLVLVARESRNVLRSFWRNRSGAFFTVLLPVMFLVFFGAINRDATVLVDPRGPQVGYTTFFAPGMLGMAIMAGTFVSLVIGLSVMRDDGQLKRLRGTPLPPWAFFTGQVVSRLVLVVVEAALVLGLGRLLFHVSLPPSVTAWVTFALVVLLGAATFRVPGSRSAACRTGWPRSPTPSRSPPCWTACGRH
jgi:ABC-2 type transport system permease protein